MSVTFKPLWAMFSAYQQMKGERGQESKVTLTDTNTGMHTQYNSINTGGGQISMAI